MLISKKAWYNFTEKYSKVNIFLAALICLWRTWTSLYLTEAAARSVLWIKVFLKISQNSQENTCARVSFLIKLQDWGLQLFEKRDSGSGVFACKFCEISKNTFFTEHLWTTASGMAISRSTLRRLVLVIVITSAQMPL